MNCSCAISYYSINFLYNLGYIKRLNSEVWVLDMNCVFAKNIDTGWEFFIDKPQLMVTWDKGIKAFEKGNFSEAEKQFEKLNLEKNRIQTRSMFSGNLLMHPGYNDLGNYKDYPNSSEVLSRITFVGCAPNYSEEIFTYIEEVLKKYE